MFGETDSPDDTDRSGMPSNDDPSGVRALLDVSVNIVPVGILLFFVALFVTYGSYPTDPLVTLVQMALILLPAFVVTVVTYYAVRRSPGTNARGVRRYRRATRERTPRRRPMPRQPRTPGQLPAVIATPERRRRAAVT